jgi:hypothetical protein
MGLFDPPQEKLDDAYNKGVEDSRTAGQLSQAAHDLGEVLVPPSLQDPEVRAHNQGWEDQTSGKVKVPTSDD